MVFLHPGLGRKRHFHPTGQGKSGDNIFKTVYEPCKAVKFCNTSSHLLHLRIFK